MVKCESSNLVLLFQKCFSYSIISRWILQSACEFLQNMPVGILIGIKWNLQICLGSTANWTTLSLLIHKHGMSFHLFRSLISLNNALRLYVLYIFLKTHFSIFIPFYAIVKGTGSLVSFSNCSLLVCRKRNSFHMLILYHAICWICWCVCIPSKCMYVCIYGFLMIFYI